MEKQYRETPQAIAFAPGENPSFFFFSVGSQICLFSNAHTVCRLLYLYIYIYINAVYMLFTFPHWYPSKENTRTFQYLAHDMVSIVCCNKCQPSFVWTICWYALSKIHKVLRQNAMQLDAVMQWPEKFMFHHEAWSLWRVSVPFLLTICLEQDNWVATLNILNLETVNSSTAGTSSNCKAGVQPVGWRLSWPRYCNVQAGLQSVFKMSTQSLKHGLLWT